ncbi:hypothetical protein CcCBS67573_g04402 [Chytriomyces confervae]|uniref:Uncharacterized protein n=1 Tax=Chytriomyces confervae TaxID=246404 RepID=A0A507FF06_9FUNG|nr:hypothetical protein CcCBS67573_g04402 [Chytriomyces confervae]
MSVENNSAGTGHSVTGSYGSLTAAMPECTRFDSLDGVYELRGSQRFEFVANHAIRTTLSFMAVRSGDRSSTPSSESTLKSLAVSTSTHQTPNLPALSPVTPLTADSDGDSNGTNTQTLVPPQSNPTDTSRNTATTPTISSVSMTSTASEKEKAGDKFFGKMRRKTSFYIPNSSSDKSSSSSKGNTSSFVEKIKTYENLAMFLGSENLFIAGFGDGTVLILDKDRDDTPTVAPVSTDANTGFTVSKPTKSAQKHNPVAHWALSKRLITSIQFSPDSIHVAITSLDGCLRILDYTQDKLLDTCSSYFGGLLCCAWSPDGKYVATGGEDDLVTVWTFGGKIIARCQGHSSWVTGVAFDAYNCTERNYRIGSVSDDTKLCLWDFSSSSLHKPRSSRKSRVEQEKNSSSITHPVLGKKQVAILEPFLCESIHNEPLSFVAFREDAIVTADRVGAIKFWARPSV